MKVDFKQIKKELFSAEFIAESEKIPYGRFSFQGELGSMNGIWNGIFSSHTLAMHSEDERKHIWKHNYYRPYHIVHNGSCNGLVYQTEYIKNVFNRYDYHKLQLNEKEYQLYPIGYGKDGYRNPIYSNGSQVALIEKGAVIYNDLHKYSITAINEDSAMVAILFCCYMYTIGCYVPGETAHQSIIKNYNKSNNKDLLAKDNFSFVDDVS